MHCAICKYGETRPGISSMTLERDNATILFKEVPGEICDSCGEVYYSSDVTTELLQQAEQAYRAGAEIELRRYRHAH